MTIYYKTNVTVNQLTEKPLDEKKGPDLVAQKNLDRVVKTAIISVIVCVYIVFFSGLRLVLHY